MKRLILTLAIALFALTSNAGTVTKHFDNLKKFTGIQICNAFQATLIQGDEYTAKVTIDTEFEEALDVSVVGTVLYVRLKDRDPRSNIRNLGRKVFNVTITAPELSQIFLTGSATLTSNDTWVSPMEKFTLDVSGAAKATKLRIEGGELEANVSGASNAGVTGDFASVDVEISGASALFLIGNYDEISVEASGTSKVSFMGSAESIESECSGSSFLDALELKVKEAKIECSGASKANIDVSDNLDVELKGASTCNYRSSNPSINVTPSVSRASSFKRVK